jgi:hypothetical protein
VVSEVLGSPVVGVVGGLVVGVVGGWVVGVNLAVVEVEDTAPPPPAPWRCVVVATAGSRALVLASPPPETPRYAPAP